MRDRNQKVQQPSVPAAPSHDGRVCPSWIPHERNKSESFSGYQPKLWMMIKLSFSTFMIKLW